MKASEAKELNDKYAATQQLDPESIYEKIRRAAASGRTSVSVSLMKIDYSYRGRVYLGIKAALEENGFTVSRST